MKQIKKIQVNYPYGCYPCALEERDDNIIVIIKGDRIKFIHKSFKNHFKKEITYYNDEGSLNKKYIARLDNYDYEYRDLCKTVNELILKYQETELYITNAMPLEVIITYKDGTKDKTFGYRSNCYLKKIYDFIEMHAPKEMLALLREYRTF